MIKIHPPGKYQKMARYWLLVFQPEVIGSKDEWVIGEAYHSRDEAIRRGRLLAKCRQVPNVIFDQLENKQLAVFEKQQKSC